MTLEQVKQLLAELQRHLVQAQTEEYCRSRRRCQRCGAQRPLKDRRPRQLRSLFGVVAVRAPRFAPCRCRVGHRQPFSPVGEIMPTAKTIISGDGVNHPDQFLVMGPADREDIVVDLSDPHLLGQKVTLLNEGPAYDPFQGIAPDGIREARPWTQLSNPSWQAAWPPFVIRLHQILLVHPC
ncbi:MAG: hypothetical protein ACJ8AW_53195 [Rhodopila sp.]